MGGYPYFSGVAVNEIHKDVELNFCAWLQKALLLKFISISVLAVVVGSLIVWHGIVARQRFQSSITKVHVGMARIEVIQILGQPQEFKKPCYPAKTACDEDLVYPEPFNFASFWTISLDASGHVIDKYLWQSP